MSTSTAPTQRLPKMKNPRRRQKNGVPGPSYAEAAARECNSAPKNQNQKLTHA
jgi:hypothetical protein